MRIKIAAVGNEILSGIAVNTNAAFLSRELLSRGYAVSSHVVLPDDRKSIRQEIEEGLKKSDLIIATGGLGPTIDDLTLESVKGIFKEPHKELKNHVGKAPGAFFFQDGKGLILLPGVPREMEEMFLREAAALIEKHFPVEKEHRLEFSLCLFKEREIDPFLRDLKEEHPEIDSGIYPAQGTLRISLKSKNALEPIGDKFKAKFPTYVFQEKKIEEAVHAALIRAEKKLALAESCTGGAISARLSAIPNASYFLLGSVVAYSNEWKERFLHVLPKTLADNGAVSRETVEEMVEGLFKATSADYAIAVSGIAGPSGGTAEKPVGTIYVAIGKRGERTDAGLIHAPKDRASAIDFTVQTSLSALWRRLVHNTPTFT